MCIHVTAQADTLIVLSKDHETYRNVATTISANIKMPSKVMVLGEALPGNLQNTFQSVVTVGSKATIALFDELPKETRLFATFLPRQTYQALVKKHKQHPRIKLKQITATFLDQPYARQFNLTRILVPKASNISTVLGPNSQKDLQLLRSTAEHFNFFLSYRTLDVSDSPVKQLQPLINAADVFLALPDKSIFNRTTAKWILYIAFKKKIPLISFSKKYVEAGALAAVYSTPQQIGQQTAELINNSDLNKPLPEAQYPKYFSVVTNAKAAQALGIQLLSDSAIAKQLQEHEH